MDGWDVFRDWAAEAGAGHVGIAGGNGALVHRAEPGASPRWSATFVTVAGALVVVLIGIPASTIVERESGHTDPGFVVIDEVAGQWVALAVAPVELAMGCWLSHCSDSSIL